MILIFRNVIANINSIIVIMFFDKTYKAIFNHFFIIKFIENKFFNLLIVYFNIIKTNNKDLFHFHYLVWLKNMSNLSNFCIRIYITNIFYIYFI